MRKKRERPDRIEEEERKTRERTRGIRREKIREFKSFIKLTSSNYSNLFISLQLKMLTTENATNKENT